MTECQVEVPAHSNKHLILLGFSFLLYQMKALL